MSENPGPYMYVLSQWQLDDLRREWLISDEAAAAVTAAAAAYHKTECIYGRELTTLRKVVEEFLAAPLLGDWAQCYWHKHDSMQPMLAVTIEEDRSHLRAALPVSHVES